MQHYQMVTPALLTAYARTELARQRLGCLGVRSSVLRAAKLYSNAELLQAMKPLALQSRQLSRASQMKSFVRYTLSHSEHFTIAAGDTTGEALHWGAARRL